VLLDRSSDVSVLRAYRTQLGVVLAVSLLVAAALGFGVARRGLAPLGALAARMHAIDERSLDRRVGTAGAPAEVLDVAASMDSMLQRLDDAFRALTESSSELAHELRTPLHLLRQHAEVALSRTRTPEEYREVLRSSIEEIDGLRRMVDDILFLARAEDPRSTIRPTSLPVAVELEEVADYLGALAGERGLELDVAAPPGLAIVADRTLLRRALVNLVGNSIDHTPRGGRVRLVGREDADAVILEVHDTGHGIPPDLLPRLFDRHTRGQSPDPSAIAGSGLGLPIVRSILKLHGGTAAIESTLGQGTTVALRFPRPNPLPSTR
jgi:two-component system heavy metal sensor histidine kinase CusS